MQTALKECCGVRDAVPEIRNKQNIQGISVLKEYYYKRLYDYLEIAALFNAL